MTNFFSAKDFERQYRIYYFFQAQSPKQTMFVPFVQYLYYERTIIAILGLPKLFEGTKAFDSSAYLVEDTLG